ncbi:neuronal pentraxin-2-like isoform X1 [Oculina patagonica]
MMFAAKSICFFLFLMFVAVTQVVSSTGVNKTTAEGKVFITGDHNEVVVSTARETKIALAEIKSKLQSLSAKDEDLARKLQALDERNERGGKLDAINETVNNCCKTVGSLEQKLEKKLDLVNESNAALALQLEVMSQTLQTTIEKQGKLDAINETIKTLSKTVESLEETVERKMGSLNKSNTALSVQVQMMSQRLGKLEKQAAVCCTSVAPAYALLFPRKGTSDYVITRGMPSLKAVTVCLWMKTADTGNYGTPLSYAVTGSRGSDNELNLLDYGNFWFSVGNAGSGYTSVSANDGKWHHICATWENTAGSWNLFKDGKVAASGKGLKTGHVIRGGGALVLGQEQDSVGGTFDAGQSFIGEMTGVNIWDRAINDTEIMRMSQSCLTGVGNVFQWSDLKAHLKGAVKIIPPSC